MAVIVSNAQSGNHLAAISAINNATNVLMLASMRYTCSRINAFGEDGAKKAAHYCCKPISKQRTIISEINLVII